MTSTPGDDLTAEAQGFSNIALVKYMGKSDSTRNAACNPSLSYTLPHLRTTAVVRSSSDARDRWQPLVRAGNEDLRLSADGERRLLAYVRRLCDGWGHRARVVVQSANNFPADAGLASSASSFSAVTKAVAAFLGRGESNEELARLSQTASGSSCRSFFGPWCAWDGERLQALDFHMERLLHLVVLVDERRKSVSSSQAHARVLTSPRFVGRPERARARMEVLVTALSKADWPAAYAVSWEEFMDMHALFETSDPPFGYRTEASERVLAECKAVWEGRNDGPIVTMDAGSNVHLLFRPEQRQMFAEAGKRFSAVHRVMTSEPTQP